MTHDEAVAKMKEILDGTYGAVQMDTSIGDNGNAVTGYGLYVQGPGWYWGGSYEAAFEEMEGSPIYRKWHKKERGR